jgi:adenine-specific DNA-methyltransferase
MQNLLHELKDLLQKDERLVVEGKLLKNKIIELGLQLDPSLLKMLLSHPNIKKHFFQDVEKIFVFDKIKFQKFVSNKTFLPDSYTSFKNKIGLTINDQYLYENKDVVLSWAYKDCILEGNQTKENKQNKEIFWNATLAPDEIDRLLNSKVLTNFKKYSNNTKDKIKNISIKDNLFIRGNNLLALYSLLKVYRARIKLIYIDPPYNTGNDSFKYNDSFKISADLDFIFRLIKNNINYKYLNFFTVAMEIGGMSTGYDNIVIKLKEDLKILKKYFRNYISVFLIQKLNKIKSLKITQDLVYSKHVKKYVNYLI